MDPRRKASEASTAVVTESRAQAALRRGAARELEGAEERALRMRLGAAVPRDAALERVDTGLDEELEIELQAFQIEAWLRWRAHLAAQRSPRPATQGAVRAPARAAPGRTPAAPDVDRSRTREKIVRALRRKG